MKNCFAALTLFLLAFNSFNVGAVPLQSAPSVHTLTDISTGWYAVDNGDGPGIGIVPLTGVLNPSSPNEYRGYFVFDISGVQGRITGARLQVRRGAQSMPLTFGLWDVTTSAGAVMTYAPGEHARNQSIWNDLGSGKSYGAFSTSIGNANDQLEFVLNTRALNDISNESGLFAIGASVLSSNIDSGAYIFGGGSYPGSWTENSHLVLDVRAIPEPTTTTLLLLGMLALFALEHRRTRR